MPNYSYNQPQQPQQPQQPYGGYQQPYGPQGPMDPQNQIPEPANQFMNDFIKATLHFFITIGYFLFALPFGLWCKAIQNLGKQRETGALRIGKINSPWPFFSFLKTFFLEFVFDACSYLAYPLGLLIGLGTFLYAISNHGDFGTSFAAMLGIWIGAYYMPLLFAWGRDGFQLFLILPIRKFLSFLRKPAQHLDLVQKVDLDVTENK